MDRRSKTDAVTAPVTDPAGELEKKKTNKQTENNNKQQ